MIFEQKTFKNTIFQKKPKISESRSRGGGGGGTLASSYFGFFAPMPSGAI